MKNQNPLIDFEHIRIIVASSLGTIFEWYDFSLYASLASNIAQHFFSALPPNSAFVMALFTFAAGVALRPFGALVFGHIGDKIGRKYSFLVTIVMMGVSTFLVGLLPTYETVGIAAPIMLFTLRCIQGLAVGGEYGGAVTYLAEHAPNEKRGFYTGFLQATAPGGFLLSTLVVILCQIAAGKQHFELWVWRIPFLLSIFLLVFSIFIRIKLQESPIFLKMKSEGKQSDMPLKESFGNLQNLSLVAAVLFGAVAGQAALSYSAASYVMYFLTQTLKIDSLTVNLMLSVVLLVSMVSLFLTGWLSDVLGRKPLVMLGLFLGAISLYPTYVLLTHFGSPDLELAMQRFPARVIADPEECSFQLVPSELKKHIKFTSSCDILKNLLNQYSVSYTNKNAPAGSLAVLKIGNLTVSSVDINKLNNEDARIAQKKFARSVIDAILASGYPIHADPEKINIPMVLLVWSLFGLITSFCYGPLAAWLVELFPTRIRYTSLSLPYHIGNSWFGGFVPTIGFAIVILTGNIYSGLWFPIIVGVLSFIIGMLFLNDTNGVDITKSEKDAPEKLPAEKLFMRLTTNSNQ